jgi:hypothetical protein
MTLQVSAVAAVPGLLIGLAAGLVLNAGADIAELLRRALCTGRDVSHVVVEGELVVQDFRPTRCDMGEVVRAGAAAAAALWERARSTV